MFFLTRFTGFAAIKKLKTGSYKRNIGMAILNRPDFPLSLRVIGCVSSLFYEKNCTMAWLSLSFGTVFEP